MKTKEPGREVREDVVEKLKAELDSRKSSQISVQCIIGKKKGYCSTMF